MVFPSIDSALSNLARTTDHVIVFGGGEIYRSLIEEVDTLHISTLDTEPEGYVFFPDIPASFHLVFEQSFRSNINYRYQIWVKDSNAKTN